MNGFGILMYDKGRKYIGEFVDDLRHGNGRFTFENGSEYDGQWQLGLQHGEGSYKGK